MFARPVALLALLLFTAPAPAQGTAPGPDPAVFVRDLYVRFAATDPTPQMVSFWVNELKKGREVNDVIANVLGSDQAFSRSQRNYDVWVSSLYPDLLGRPAEPGAAEHWRKRLRELRDDRVKLAREFLQAAGAEIAGGAGGPPPNVRPEELPDLLRTTTQLLNEATRAECAGANGWMLREQANYLSTTVANAMRVLRNPAANPKGYAETVTSIDQALGIFRTNLSQSRFQAPQTKLHADQAAQVVAALAGNAGIAPPPGPGGLPGGLSRADARRLSQAAGEMDRDAAAASATFRSILGNNWSARQLLRDVEGYANETDSLRSDIRAGYPVAELVARTQGLNQVAANVSAAVSKGGVDVRVYQAWYKAAASLAAFTQLVGAGAGPGPVPPVGGGVTVPREAFAAIDQAIAECDAVILGLKPYSFYHRSVAPLIADLQDLRNRYATLRQTALRPTLRRELEGQLDGIAAKYRPINANWREASRDPRLQNIPDLNDLAVADREVVRHVSAAR